MGKFLKILITIIVFVIVILGILDYMGFFTVGETPSDGHCKEFVYRVDPQSKQNISEIINTMANTSTMGLAFKAGHLKALGKEVDQKVPSPLVFLAVIFGNEELARAMKKVKQSSFKYNNFCEGLYPNMQKFYKNKECFKRQLLAFSKMLKLNAEETYTIAETCGRHGEDGDKDAFRPFVDYLIEKKAK